MLNCIYKLLYIFHNGIHQMNNNNKKKKIEPRKKTTNFLYNNNNGCCGCWVLYARAIWITWENLWRHLTRHDHLITIINNTNVWLFCARSCYFNRKRSNCWWGVSLNDILNWVTILLVLLLVLFWEYMQSFLYTDFLFIMYMVEKLGCGKIYSFLSL